MRMLKETLEVKDVQCLVLPADAQILTVQAQNGVPCIWFSTSETQGMKSVAIYTLGTGHEADCAGTYLGTYQLYDGKFVGHVFIGE